MLLLMSEFSTLASIIKFVVLLIVFIGLLFAASWFTRWYARSAMPKQRFQNVSVIESYPFGPGRTVFILKIGAKYVAVAAARDRITVLAELTEDELNLEPQEIPKLGTFGDMFSELIKKKKKTGD